MFAVGDRESYGIDEWILIPFNLMSIYQWAGQSLAVVLAPMVAVLLIGIGLIIWRMKRAGTLGTAMLWSGVLAGLLFVGTGMTTLFECARIFVPTCWHRPKSRASTSLYDSA